jgi:hypothetical protein
MPRPESALVTVACCLLLVSAAWSEEVVSRIEWQALAAAGTLKSGTVVAGPDGPSLRVVHRRAAAVTLPLATIERPAIRTARYALRGRVRYEGVAPGSYLEMWSHLPEGAFFSRSLAQSGPLRRLEGSSGWRTFVLPFFNREGGPPPDRLVLNLVLTGAGTVDIGPLELVQLAAGEDPLAGAVAWWSGRQAGLFGAVAGSTLGILGALIGWLGSAGRGRRFVLWTLTAIGWLGVIALGLGAGAYLRGQPYEVYYPLALLGSISTALGFSLPRALSKRYDDLELRRMRALDV